MADKSGIFHLGHATDYEQKSVAYWQKTGTDIKFETDPLWIVFDKFAQWSLVKKTNSFMATW
jgi:hypothetical protein